MRSPDAAHVLGSTEAASGPRFPEGSALWWTAIEVDRASGSEDRGAGARGADVRAGGDP